MPASVLGDRYRLDEVIGSGTSGVVWLAHDEVLARPVAVKVLHRHLAADPGTVERFRREAVASADLNHPNIVRVHDVGADDESSYLVMEHVDGPTLGEFVRRYGPLDPDTVAAVGFQVASALGAAHDRHLIHRDMKPANILLTSDGFAKVADFGLAKAIGAATAALTVPGTLLGTVAYLAPEQLSGDDLDARVDVYSLGLVLLECLSGEPAFRGETPPEVAAARMVDDPVRATQRRPDVPAALDDALARATRRNRDARFADASAFAAALEPLVPDLPQEPVAELLREVGVPDSAASAAAVVAPPDETVRVPAIDRTTQVETVRDRTEPVPPVRSERPAAPAAPRTRRPAPPTEDPTTRDEGVGRLAVAVGVIVLLTAAVATGWVLSRPGDGRSDQAAGAEPRGPLEVAAAQDFDPFGGGDEHPDEVPDAFDGDPSTSWRTERYSSSDLGGLKDGVGIWFDLGRPADVAAVELDLASEGLDLQVYALGAEPGSDPATWGQPIGEVSDSGPNARLEVPDGVSQRYWLLWVTSLGPGGGRAEVAEVRFLPR